MSAADVRNKLTIIEPGGTGSSNALEDSIAVGKRTVGSPNVTVAARP
jgi:hypothetical protein